MLELEELHRRFGDVVALDGMTFAVEAGKVVGFLGPNGAGKTTAMRAVLGVTALDSGTIRFDGRGVDARARRHFGYMPEERGLYPGMRVLDQLEYLGRLHGIDAAAAQRSARRQCERLGLAERVDSKVEELSLGNQQRVQLAAALVHEPDLLVLDEPFSGLDPVGIDDLSAVLAERAHDGATVLFSSHQLDLVEHLCEAVAIVDRGRLVAAGPVEELTRGGRPRLAVRVAGDPDGRWTSSLAPGAPVQSVEHETVMITLDEGVAADAVLDAARAAGSVEHFAFERRRLYEVLREAVRRPRGRSPSAASSAPPRRCRPVSLPLLFAYALSFGIVFGSSSNGLFQVLAYIPPTAPIASTTLYAIGSIGLGQVAVSAVICLLATVATARLAASVYERSILRIGARVRLREALRPES